MEINYPTGEYDPGVFYQPRMEYRDVCNHRYTPMPMAFRSLGPKPGSEGSLSGCIPDKGTYVVKVSQYKRDPHSRDPGESPLFSVVHNGQQVPVNPEGHDWSPYELMAVSHFLQTTGKISKLQMRERELEDEIEVTRTKLQQLIRELRFIRREKGQLE